MHRLKCTCLAGVHFINYTDRKEKKSLASKSYQSISAMRLLRKYCIPLVVSPTSALCACQTLGLKYNGEKMSGKTVVCAPMQCC